MEHGRDYNDADYRRSSPAHGAGLGTELGLHLGRIVGPPAGVLCAGSHLHFLYGGTGHPS